MKAWGPLSLEAVVLLGALSGSASAAGALTTAIPCVGSLAGTGTSAGTLTTAISLDTTITASASTSADLTTGLPLSAGVTAAASTIADLTTAIPIEASLTAAASANGELTTGAAQTVLSPRYRVFRHRPSVVPHRHAGLAWGSAQRTSPTAAALESAVTGSATVSAALSTAIPCAGSVTGQGTVSADLTGGTPTTARVVRYRIVRSHRQPPRTGQGGTSERSWGAIEAGNPPLASAVTGTGTATGAFTTAIPLTGNLRPAFLTLSPARRVSTHRLVWTQPSRQQPPTVAALTTSIAMVGALTGQATVSAPFTTTIAFMGSVAGTGTADGAPLDIGRPLEGATGGTSTATADGLTGNAAALVAAVQGETTIVASLTTSIPLNGAVAASAVAAGAFSTAIPYGGSLTGQGTISGALDTAIPLTASVTGAGTSAGIFTTTIAYAAVITGTASATGDFSTAIPLIASGAGAATVFAELEIAVHGTAAGTSTASASTLDTAITVVASSAGTSATAAVLSTAAPLAGAAQGTATVTGSLTFPTLALAGSLNGTSTATAITAQPVPASRTVTILSQPRAVGTKPMPRGLTLIVYGNVPITSNIPYQPRAVGTKPLIRTVTLTKENIMFFWPDPKGPGDTLDFKIVWIGFLEGDTISASDWTVPSGITKSNESFTPTSTHVWLAGGADGQDYDCVNTITMASGRMVSRTARLSVRA